jgi:RHS repeat-associated protein
LAKSRGGDTLAETDSTGSTANANYHEYVLFAGRRIARSDPSSGSVYFFFADQLGSMRSATTANGTVCFQSDYTPYGQEINYTNSCPQHYKFTGYERDSETNLDYASARYYSSRLGRFLSADHLPGNIYDPQSLNRYAYVANRPLNAVDPTGNCTVSLNDELAPARHGHRPHRFISCNQLGWGRGSGGAGGGAGGGNPSGSCLYLNAAGTGISPDEGQTGGGIDPNSNLSECEAQGGAFSFGTISSFSTDPNSNLVEIYSDQGIAFGSPGSFGNYFSKNQVLGDDPGYEAFQYGNNWGVQNLNPDSYAGCVSAAGQALYAPGTDAGSLFAQSTVLIAGKANALYSAAQAVGLVSITANCLLQIH